MNWLIALLGICAATMIVSGVWLEMKPRHLPSPRWLKGGVMAIQSGRTGYSGGARALMCKRPQAKQDKWTENTGMRSSRGDGRVQDSCRKLRMPCHHYIRPRGGSAGVVKHSRMTVLAPHRLG